MESGSTRDSQVRIGFAPEEATVLNWPLRQEGMRAWGMLLIAAAFVAVIGWQLRSWPIAVGLAIAFVAILWRLWLPVRYEFRRHGIVQVILGRRTRIPWTSIAGYKAMRRGVLLTPELDGQPLSSLRALFIAWGGREAEILAHLDFYLGPTSTDASGTATAAAGKVDSRVS